MTLALCGSTCIALAQKEKVELSLTAPANGAVFTAPISVPLSAIARAALLPAAAAEHAINNPQAIATVEFFAGATLVGTVTGPRTDNVYGITWTNPAPGTYSISARASNGKGDSAVSGTISIVVNAPPTVSLSTPVAVVTAPGTINLSAAPADTDGTIQKVDFFRGTTLVGTVTSAPFSVQLHNQAAGIYSFTARVTDNHGATGDSSNVSVIVNEAPSVALSTPAAVVIAPGSITLTAAPTDVDGTIQKVDFFRGTTLLGTANASPYQLELTDLPSGTYVFTAVASDNHDATGASAAVSVRVNSPPTVTLSSTAASLRAPANIPLTALPLDLDGTIAKVELFNGSDLIATLTADPFSATWSQVPQGTYTLTALVTDDLGASVSSTPILVNVTAAEAKLYFIHVDHLNTPRLVSDEQQGVVWRWDHGEPFGASAPNDNPTGAGKFQYPIRLSGGYADDEIGTVQTHFRDSDPALGRFAQSDPIGLLGGVNTYSYVANNPLLHIDPTGLAYFAHRPLESMPFGFRLVSNAMGPLSVAHEHLFFEDGKLPSNIGFGPDGPYSEVITSGYTFSQGGFNDCIMRMAVASTPPRSYNLFCSNCQHWARDVREQYAILSNDPAVLKQCGCEPQTQAATSTSRNTNQSSNTAAAAMLQTQRSSASTSNQARNATAAAAILIGIGLLLSFVF